MAKDDFDISSTVFGKSPAPKSVREKKPDRTAIRKIVDSGFDFLDRAATEISTHPKYSVINFATGIELMLKARLMKEHWSLVVDKTSEAVLKDFMEGKLKTVTPREAIKRLRNVCNETISEDAKVVFEKVADHRNKVIHFFHEAAGAKPTPAQVSAITQEQCLGWYHLERLLQQWGKPFTKHPRGIQHVDQLMRANRQYLTAIYTAELPTISTEEKSGVSFFKCVGCDFNSARVSNLTDMIVDQSCLVCRLDQRYIEVKCNDPDCGTTIRILAEYGSSLSCPSCGEDVDATEVADALNTDTSDLSDPQTQMNCAFCMGYGSVVEHHELYVCTECWSIASEIAGCGWCGELQIGGGDLVDSYHSGCEFCDGAIGWRKDD